MTSVQMPPNYEATRPHSQHGVHSSPIVSSSPRVQRSSSQMPLHLAPMGGNSVISNGNGTFSPLLPPDSAAPLNSYHGHAQAHAQPYKMYTPTPTTVSFPQASPCPNTYGALPYYPVYDARSGSQPMQRTVSHAHPIHSATEHTTSSVASPRYSSSPQSAFGVALHHSPPSATFQHQHQHYQVPHLQPTINFTGTEERHHINPSLFNPNFQNPHVNAHTDGYPLSRSTSGASVSDLGNDAHRLLTPHYEYRNELSPSLAPSDDLRKVSDPMSYAVQGGRHRFYPNGLAPNYATHDHGLGLGPHPQPHGDVYYRAGPMPVNRAGGPGYPGVEHYALSAERGEQKPPVNMMPFGSGMMGSADTEYERQRAEQIMDNRKLFEEVGLSGQAMFRPREISTASSRPRKQVKRRLLHETPSRASPRIASRNSVSYNDLDGGDRSNTSSGSGEDYASDGEYEDEDDFRPVAKRSKGRGVYGRKSYAPSKFSRKHRPELSLWGLLQPYPEIPHLFPLFYYTLNNDLTINPDSVPLIGSIPSTCSPLDKAETLRAFFHRGRRVLSQLDSFTTRCDRKYEGPDEKWPEMEYFTRIAIRDVRRKVVERCENYKYTRRDILDKVLGKGKWQHIETGFVAWNPSSGINDPANDLANVTLTLPTPPPSAYHTEQVHMQQQPIAQPQRQPSSREIKPFPSRARTASSQPHSSRIMSVNMDAPSSAAPMSSHMPMSALVPPMSAMNMSMTMSPMPCYHQHQHQQQHQHQHSPMPYSAYSTPLPPPASAMYGEDDVPMTVQMPLSGASQAQSQPSVNGQATVSPIGVGAGVSSLPVSAAPLSSTSAPMSAITPVLSAQSQPQAGQEVERAASQTNGSQHSQSSPIAGNGSWSDGYVA